MILADKIIELRKKNGWSQEELADVLNVSRQSVSKWESAQSIPDMNRILKMSEVFGVSTDYLLKDEMDAPEYLAQPESDSSLRSVSMEEAQDFLTVKEKNARQVSLGVLLCILSPAVLLLLGALQETGKIALSENAAGGIGLTVLFLMIGAAVALFVLTGIRTQKYEYLEKEPIETAYGVSGLVREQMTRFQPRFTAWLTTGIVLCVVSVAHLRLAAEARVRREEVWEGAVVSVRLPADHAHVHLVHADRLALAHDPHEVVERVVDVHRRLVGDEAPVVDALAHGTAKLAAKEDRLGGVFERVA